MVAVDEPQLGGRRCECGVQPGQVLLTVPPGPDAEVAQVHDDPRPVSRQQRGDLAHRPGGPRGVPVPVARDADAVWSVPHQEAYGARRSRYSQPAWILW